MAMSMNDEIQERLRRLEAEEEENEDTYRKNLELLEEEIESMNLMKSRLAADLSDCDPSDVQLIHILEERGDLLSQKEWILKEFEETFTSSYKEKKKQISKMQDDEYERLHHYIDEQQEEE